MLIVNLKKLLPLLTVTALVLLLVWGNSEKQRYRRTVVNYQIPAVSLLNQQGQPVELRRYLTANQPIMLEFIFTSCTTLCPSLSVKYANLQKQLGPDSSRVRLVSITVDPETDRPEVLQAYLQRYQAQPGWDFLTGSVPVIKKVMAAFDIKASDMITLDSSLLLRSPKSGQWTRVDGQLDGRDFLREYQLLIK